jgi:hypothetical protein
MLLFSSLIFKVSINAHRTAAANADIMQKLRAITDQLNADFKGRRWIPGGRILFNLAPTGDVRADCIAFFADGDFQSTGQYGKTSGAERTVVGNVAGIFLGQDAKPDPNSDSDESAKRRGKILLRRQTILTFDSNLPPPNLTPPGEYYDTSLSEWYADKIDANDLIGRPDLNSVLPADFNNLSVMYLAKGVDNFKIQFAEWGGNRFKWVPTNTDIETKPDDWKKKDIVTRAFKFTFTLYDSKGIIEKGRTFTHIVYVGD